MQTTRRTNEIIIIGETNEGLRFRPSDWTERLVDLSPRMLDRYSDNLTISRYNGIKSIVLNESLQDVCQMTYERLLEFARINNLKMINNKDEGGA